MAIIKDFGVVLKEYAWGESNKRLVLLTQHHGKLTVFARGSKRVGSKLAAGLFCYCEFMIFEGPNFLSLNQIAPITSFSQIAEDYDSFCTGSYFLELTDKMVLAKMETAEILQLLLQAFAQLAATRHAPGMVFAVFTFRLLKLEGFAPLVDNCASCDGRLNQNCWFSHEGLICEVCANTAAQKIWISPQTAAALKYILEAEIERAFSFTSSADVQTQLYSAARLFLEANVDVELKSLKIIT